MVRHEADIFLNESQLSLGAGQRLPGPRALRGRRLPGGAHLTGHQLRPRGRRSVHFNGARDELRHAVLDVLVAHEVTAMVVQATGRRGLQQRETCAVGCTRSCTRARPATTICTATRNHCSGQRMRSRGRGSGPVRGVTGCARWSPSSTRCPDSAKPGPPT